MFEKNNALKLALVTFANEAKTGKVFDFVVFIFI